MNLSVDRTQQVLEVIFPANSLALALHLSRAWASHRGGGILNILLDS